MYTKAPRLCIGAAVIALLAAAPATLRAQGASAPSGTARVEGRVRDSLPGHTLDSALVQLVRLEGGTGALTSVRTRADGRFRFDSLAAGRYAVSFSTDFLDSLALVVPDRLVDVPDGARIEITLATPSAATLRAAACPGTPLARGRGAVVGAVTDAATERPVPAAMVVVAWSDLTVDRRTLRATRIPRTGMASTDASGRYRLCGVPADVLLQLQVQRDSATSSAVEVMVSDSIGMVRQDLSLMMSTPRIAAVSDTGGRGGAMPLASGAASVTGVARGAGSRPLADVDVRIAGVPGSARSDSLGRYLLAGLPGGTQMLEARRLGYVMLRVPVQLRDGRVATQDLQLVRIVTLDSIRIVAQRARYPEYERHRKSGWGTYLDEAEILRRNPFRTSDLLRMAPGFRVERQGLEEVVVSTRSRYGRGSCAPNVVIDGMQRAALEMVHPSAIAAMEIYPSSSVVPVEYAGQSPCGAIVIWTRR